MRRGEGWEPDARHASTPLEDVDLSQPFLRDHGLQRLHPAEAPGALQTPLRSLPGSFRLLLVLVVAVVAAGEAELWPQGSARGGL